MTDESTTPTCAKCGTAPAGPGGVLCETCTTALADRLRDYRTTQPST